MGTLLEDMFLPRPRPRLAPLSVNQFEAMVTKGILPEGAPIELIDGFLVYKDRAAEGEDPMTVGTRHAVAITGLMDLAPSFKRFGLHLRAQQPIRLVPKHEPEPDIAIVRGSRREFAKRHPEAADVVAVVEVSDSSLEYDRTTKLHVYAQAGIDVYVIVDLVNDRFVHFSTPKGRRYMKRTIAKSGSVTIARVAVRVADVIP